MEPTTETQSTTIKTKRISVIETGHAKNVDNFLDLIAFVTGYGAAYNPNKASLKLPQLNTLAAAAKTSVTDVITKNTAYNNAVNTREFAFSDLKQLATRVMNALETSDALPAKVKDAQTFNRKLQGKRATQAETSNDTNAPAPPTISSSQQSYSQKIQHFAGIISILQSEPTYLPNEAALKITALTAKQTDLSTKNNSVSSAHVGISNSRIARDKALYTTETGLVDIALEVKKYIKSAFGSASPEFNQVKGIPFKRAKK